MAGEHAMEFPGQWASWGIIRWLISSIKEVVELRRRYRICIIPMINPDGNVAGKPQKNAQELDIAHAWPHYSSLNHPKVHENKALLQFFEQRIPNVYLGFHGYPGPRAWGDWPHEGCYVAKPEQFQESRSRICQSVINDYILWETDGGTQHRQLLWYADDDSQCEYLAGKYGTPGIVYEPLNRGHWLSMKTGIHVLKTLLKGYEASVDFEQ